MQRKTFMMILISFLLVFLTGLILFFFCQKENRIVFYATIKEIHGDNYLINPLPDENIGYSEINLIIKNNTKNYQPGDIFIITAKNTVAETYPVTMYAVSAKLFKKGIKEVTTKAPENIIEESSDKHINQVTISDNIETPNKENNPEIKNYLYQTEESIINEFSGYIESVSNSKNDETFKTNAKNYFITVVDFIFYDQEIKGYKFSNLTNETKIKVIKLALELDNTINTKYPNYKSYMSSSYKNMKGRLVSFYLDKTFEFCQNNDLVCEEAKSGFHGLKKSLNLTWAFIASIGDVEVKKLQNWYEIFSGK